MICVETLISQAKKGNKNAMETLLQSVYPKLYKTALIYVNNETDALDIVQDSIEKIIRQLHSLNSEEYFQTWATRIAIFTSLDFLKKGNREDRDLPDEIMDTTIVSIEDNLNIYAALKKLPEDLQEITLLFYFHNFKIDEISNILMIPSGTIKYKLHIIRKALHVYIEGEEKNDPK